MQTLALELAPDMIWGQLGPPDHRQNGHEPECRYLRAVRAGSAGGRPDEGAGNGTVPGHQRAADPRVDPVDISNAVLWLASDEARYVTG
jgi:NAD(P)-dependent dehydrogenase (short-subunit alcohol dehydrogenase family)